MWPWKKRQASVIGAGMRITGRIESDGDVTVLGQVDGDILHNGRLELVGEVHGNVQVDGSLILRSTARLHGDARCACLHVEPGAFFYGSNRMDEVAVPVLAAAVAPEAPVLPPLAVLMEPVGTAEKEMLGVAVTPKAESSAFYGGFSPAIKGT
ncbi:MAG TPA: polymer-forming cytoskeletal protein [Symbiobacteriaceae bacterium]|nr:polymer-forming cytoskeletal protein [Symbiobacteriaceae bacterium]